MATGRVYGRAPGPAGGQAPPGGRQAPPARPQAPPARPQAPPAGLQAPSAGRRIGRLVGVAVLVGALTACTGTAEHPDDVPASDQVDLQRVPVSVGESLPAANSEDLWLPYQLDGLALVTPPWPAAGAKELNGVFVAPQERGGMLEFSAVDAEGTLLWRAQRPASCTGFVLASTPTGQDVAVLVDAAGSPSGAATTASAYDLRTGEPLWGPVAVPGPHRGPGLVFANMPDTFGTPADAVALDPGTGEVLDGAELADAQILAEYDGTALALDQDHLVALHRSGDGLRTRWQVPLAAHGWRAEDVAATAGTHPGDGVTLLDVGADRRVLLDLSDGEVLAEGVRDAVTDAATGTHVLLGEDGLQAIDSAGEELWSVPADADAEIRAAGGALVYLLDRGSVRVHNVLTGDVAVGYDRAGSGVIAVPTLIAPTGAALMSAGEEPVLATGLPADAITDGARSDAGAAPSQQPANSAS